MHADILITNDDGYRSIGLRAIVKELEKVGRVIAVVPEQPKSAAGLSITLHKPVRVKKALIGKSRAYLVSGTTGDCIQLALNKILSEPPKLVCSGINVGENVSLMEFFMSGTVAGAIAAALHGISAIAFSKKVPTRDVLFVDDVKTGFAEAARIARLMAEEVIQKGLPDGIDLLNVNFPEKLTSKTRILLTSMSRVSFRSTVITRTDPRGRPYYWLWGEKLREFPEGTDAHAIFNEEAISITPISLANICAIDNQQLSDLIGGVSERIKRCLASDLQG